jgi:hypothetical protein
MNSLPCDIVILPSPELQQKIIALSQQLQPHSTRFTLDGLNFYPHASIYMTQLKVDDIDKAKQLLTDVAAQFKTLALTATRYDQDLGFFDVEYDRIPELVRLQEAVLAAINPIRDGMRVKDQARMQEATGEKRQNYEAYGWASIGSLFRPHATVTRFTDEAAIDTAGLPDPTEFSGQFIGLGLFEMGDNGTCVRKIAAFNFR